MCTVMLQLQIVSALCAHRNQDTHPDLDPGIPDEVPDTTLSRHVEL